jgi:hypothetical protein
MKKLVFAILLVTTLAIGTSADITRSTVKQELRDNGGTEPSCPPSVCPNS